MNLFYEETHTAKTESGETITVGETGVLESIFAPREWRAMFTFLSQNLGPAVAELRWEEPGTPPVFCGWIFSRSGIYNAQPVTFETGVALHKVREDGTSERFDIERYTRERGA